MDFLHGLTPQRKVTWQASLDGEDADGGADESTSTARWICTIFPAFVAVRDPRSSARDWVGVFGNGALRTGELVVVRISSILN
jgi:hypothetical protein